MEMKPYCCTTLPACTACMCLVATNDICHPLPRLRGRTTGALLIAARECNATTAAKSNHWDGTDFFSSSSRLKLTLVTPKSGSRSNGRCMRHSCRGLWLSIIAIAMREVQDSGITPSRASSSAAPTFRSVPNAGDCAPAFTNLPESPIISPFSGTTLPMAVGFDSKGGIAHIIGAGAWSWMTGVSRDPEEDNHGTVTCNPPIAAHVRRHH